MKEVLVCILVNFKPLTKILSLICLRIHFTMTDNPELAMTSNVYFLIAYIISTQIAKF